MKKTLSIVLVAVMLLTSVAFAIPTGAAATAKNIEYVEALYFASAPTVDGFISDAEWGTATFTVSGNDVATFDDSQPFSRFMYWNSGAASDYRAMSYRVWLRWDENYFYIGAKVNDPDGHSLKNGTSETWNGDAIQTRIDEEGPNAVYAGDEFVCTSTITRPWGTNFVPDFLFGYVQVAGGFSEAWENSTVDTDGGHGMTAFSNNRLGVTKCVVAPAGSGYSTDTSNGITTYEIAIPWTYIFYNERAYEAPKNLTTLTYQKYVGGRNAKNEGIGRVLGMSLVVLDAQDNSSNYNAYITWGSGITHDQWEKAPQTCTGSNSVTLSAAKVDPSAASYTKYDPASLLDAKFDNYTIKNEAGICFDYLAGDTGKINVLRSDDKLKTVTYTSSSDRSYWGNNGPAGKIVYADREHGNVLYYPTEIVQTYINTSRYYPLSFTMQFDMNYTGNELVQGVGYESSIFNWFGGADGYSFCCGYYFNDGQFQIRNTSGDTIVNNWTYDYDLLDNHWYTWRFQYDNSACLVRLWIDDLSTNDDNIDNDFGTLVFNVNWRYFYYSSESAQRNGAQILFRQMNTQMMYDNVKIYNFATNLYNSNECYKLYRIVSNYTDISDYEAAKFIASLSPELAEKLTNSEYLINNGVSLVLTGKNISNLTGTFSQYFQDNMYEFGLGHYSSIGFTMSSPLYSSTKFDERNCVGSSVGFYAPLYFTSGLIDYLGDLSQPKRLCYLAKLYMSLLDNPNVVGVYCEGTAPSPTGTFKTTVNRGDLNDDGAVNAVDSIYLKLYIADAGELTVHGINADVNGDRKINSKDSLYLKLNIASRQ